MFEYRIPVASGKHAHATGGIAHGNPLVSSNVASWLEIHELYIYKSRFNVV